MMLLYRRESDILRPAQFDRHPVLRHAEQDIIGQRNDETERQGIGHRQARLDRETRHAVRVFHPHFAVEPLEPVGRETDRALGRGDGADQRGVADEFDFGRVRRAGWLVIFSAPAIAI